MADKKTSKKSGATAYHPDILYISGSPQSRASESLVALVEKGAKAAGARSQHFFLSDKHIAPCIGCGLCSKTGNCNLANQAIQGRLVDDYLELHALIERADALVIVAPLYFSGPSAQLKALFDRLQPYWARRYVLGEEPRPKRPAQLFIAGGGGDAHGYAPLVGIARSALSVADFTLEKVHAFVGFKAKDDMPVIPPESECASITKGELAHRRRAIAAQGDFEQRAVDAGGAFARYLKKIREKEMLQEELQQVEAELEALKGDHEEGLVNIDGAQDSAFDLIWESEEKAADDDNNRANEDDMADEDDSNRADEDDTVDENDITDEGSAADDESDAAIVTDDDVAVDDAADAANAAALDDLTNATNDATADDADDAAALDDPTNLTAAILTAPTAADSSDNTA